MSEFVYKPTTAFYKIKKLLRNDANTFVIQGGQGASKTVSILMILIDFCVRTKGKEVTIVSDELSKMKKTVIRDFLKIMKDWNLFRKENWNKTESIYTFDDGSYIEFIGLDVHDVGKGMRRDILYGNEANKMTIDGWVQIASRAKVKIIDFNPDSKFWGHDEIKSNNFVNLTFLDNEFLPKTEVDSILDYKKKGYDDNGNVINEWWANKWRVYGLGEVGSVEGRVFDGWKKISYIEFEALPYEIVYGIDFGKADPMAVIAAKYDRYNNSLYVHELNYCSENKMMSEISESEKTLIRQHGGIIPYILKKINVNKKNFVVCDSAVVENIELIRDKGWEFAYGIDKPPGSILAGVTLLQSTNVYYTSNSVNLEIEYNSYTHFKDRMGYIKDKFIDEFNHLIDATRYVRRHFESNR